MSDEKPKVGSIGWVDLTVPNATDVRNFYARVVGWTHDDVNMGDYADYAMKSLSGEGVAGVCHARGDNANQPGNWMVYFMVADLNASIEACKVIQRDGQIGCYVL
jgi:uncharacterized protein